MITYFGNTQHKDMNNGESFIRPSSHVQQVPNVQRAQYILSTNITDIDSKQWKGLCSKMYKSALKSTMEGYDYLGSITRTVIDWGSDNKVDENSFAKVISMIRSNFMQISLLDIWQQELISAVYRKAHTLKVYIFNSLGFDSLWVIVDDPSTDVILEYSELYIDVIENYPDANCDFMVFGKDESNQFSLPADTYTIIVKE
ncbi:MAG TPA: hypothetical protein VEB00_04845 [Clostridia bacterium]|nr:hypothetical protein [Clostridia bacterium]